ncbi:MAG: AAA family ATPase [Verrucomicrobiales bacterium]|nr:AAA family ATPase [Verrucomicrobiales bacterium]
MTSIEPQIIVVSGLPGVGKSTTARALAQCFDRAAHVEADRLQDLIVTGAAMPGLDGINSRARQQLELRLTNACLLARSFLEAGFTAIIDDIVMGPVFEDLRRHLDGVSFTFVMLMPDFDYIKQRWMDMESPFAEHWDWIDDEIRNKTERIGMWLDTTALDPTQTVDLILERLGASPV